MTLPNLFFSRWLSKMANVGCFLSLSSQQVYIKHWPWTNVQARLSAKQQLSRPHTVPSKCSNNVLLHRSFQLSVLFQCVCFMCGMFMYVNGLLQISVKLNWEAHTHKQPFLVLSQGSIKGITFAQKGRFCSKNASVSAKTSFEKLVDTFQIANMDMMCIEHFGKPVVYIFPASG